MTSLLMSPTSQTSEYPNDRLPSEQVIPVFALRGYRGPELLVSMNRYFSATQADRFVYEHQHNMRARGWPVSEVFVEQDCVSIVEMASWSDAVRVLPTR